MQPGARTVSLLVTGGLHLAAAAVLLQFDAVRKPLAEAVPMMVNLITPPRPEPPKIQPPKPRPAAPVAQPLRIEPQPLLTVESAVPSPMVIAPQPKPAPTPQPIAAPVAPVAQVPAPVPEPAPVPVVPPSFDAAYLQNPPPLYPALSRRRGEKGRVVLRVFVGAEGAAQQVEVRSSSGHERLDQAALEAVRQWRFVAARQGEKAVAAWVLVPILFALEG